MINKLTARIHTIMKSSQKSKKGLSFERFLYSLSKVYESAVLFRNHLYKTNILKSRELPCFVISIGNISAGGTGKTPMTIYLAKYLTSLGYNVAIITRGYKGRLEHKGGVVSDGNKILCNPIDAGDEPYMMAHILKLPVIAGKNRFDTGKTAIEKFSPDILVLDDGFQHMALKRNLNLLLLDARKPIGNRYLLPRGTLREPVTSIRRSDAVIFTRSDLNLDTVVDLADIGLQDIPLFKSVHVPYISNISTPDILNHIKGKCAFLFSGIADNSAFKSSCEKIGVIVCHHIEFPDHCHYTQPDIDKVTEAFKQSNAECIITTQKDYIKIADTFPSDQPLVVLDVQIEFDDNDKTAFKRFIKEKVRNYFKKNHGSD